MGSTQSTDCTSSSSIENSFQNLSLNCGGTGDIMNGGGGDGGVGNQSTTISSESVGSTVSRHESSPNRALELNSHLRMPYPWEQCLDVQTGEIYYINWKTGVKTKEDPRKMSFLRREESEEESELDLDDVLSLDSLGIDQAMQDEEEEEKGEDSSLSSTTTTTTTTTNTVSDEFKTATAAAIAAGVSPSYLHPFWEREVELENPGSSIMKTDSNDNCIHLKNQEVLVLAGCKWCYLYFMVPKQVEECPKCSGQLLRFDPLENQ